MKAFVINVIGDIGLVIGAFLLLEELGALDFRGRVRRAPASFAVNDRTLVVACLLLLVGAFAKSAQLPLHTWLPDAMEGPTPVSALIHAATMVTAGVYLIARMHGCSSSRPAAADVAAVIGTRDAVSPPRSRLWSDRPQARDRVLDDVADRLHGARRRRWSRYAAGLFHLMTHAFFKALLFMGAGSVIGAMGGNSSLDRMGGFRKSDAVHLLHPSRPARSRSPASRSSPASSPRTGSSTTRSTAAAGVRRVGDPRLHLRR